MRAKATLASVMVVASAFLVASIALVLILRATLLDGVEASARLHAQELAALVEVGSSPASLAAGADDEIFVQIVDPEGTVIASSGNVRGLTPLAMLSGGGRSLVDVRLDEPESFLVVAESADTPEGKRVVLVGRATDLVEESVATVLRLQLFGLAPVLAAVAFATWKISGRLDQSVRRQRQFVSDASHELKSPLAAIRQHAEVAKKHPQSTDVAELADIVLNETLRMQSMAAGLLLLARVDEGALAVRGEEVDLDDIVLSEVKRAGERATVQIDVTGVSGGKVWGDPDALSSIVGNLIDNAVRYARSRVSITLSEHNGQARLWVDDDGPGIPESERRRVFERFVRLDDARSREGGGNGLGLAIVMGLVRAHKGTVNASESPSGGARMEVLFPSVL